MSVDKNKQGMATTSKAEVRKRHREQEVKEDEDDDVSPEEAEPAQEQGADYWDLDDDDQWGSSAYSTSELAKRRRVLRRSNTEVGVAFVCHLAIMCYYIYVHVYDATIVKRSKGVGFDGILTFGGRWKFLTYINLWVQFVFFFLCFFTDIMPRSYFKAKFQQACDLLFTTVAIPLSFFVFALFWSIYAVNREYIYPEQLDKTIPFALNHYWHTGIAVTSVIEAVVVFHRHPSNFKAILMQSLMATLYVIWITWVFSVTGKWPYPFMKVIPLPLFPVFFLACLSIDVIFYFVGKFLCHFRWKERHQLMDELEL